MKAISLLAMVLLAGVAACDEANGASGVAKAANASPQVVAELPLKRGYYVSADTPCARASNATVVLLRREGVGGAQDFCEFKRIEQVGASSYRVTESCADLRGGDAQTSIVTYELLSERSFKSKSEQGWEHSARFCEQSSMPADWQENDISDVVG